MTKSDHVNHLALVVIPMLISWSLMKYFPINHFPAVKFHRESLHLLTVGSGRRPGWARRILRSIDGVRSSGCC